MTYSESELDSNFFNSVSGFDSKSDSESDSQSDSSLAAMNLDICIVSDGFLIHSHNRINSYASNASAMHIFFSTSFPKKFAFITPSNYLTLAFKYF